MRIIGWLDTIGSALLAQLLFLVFSIPVVTCAPAAIALQRQVAAIADGRPSGVRPFVADFAAALRQAWAAGLAFAAVAVGLGAAVPFWVSTGAWFGYAAAGALSILGGLALAFWLALLSVARDDTTGRLRDLAAAAGHRLLERPGRLLIALVLALTWLALASVLFPLLLVGSGLVPAIVVQTVVARPGGAPESAAS